MLQPFLNYGSGLISVAGQVGFEARRLVEAATGRMREGKEPIVDKSDHSCVFIYTLKVQHKESVSAIRIVGATIKCTEARKSVPSPIADHVIGFLAVSDAVMSW